VSKDHSIVHEADRANGQSVAFTGALGRHHTCTYHSQNTATCDASSITVIVMKKYDDCYFMSSFIF